MENFITEIEINRARNIKDLNITLSNKKRQHLILTGKNGSGKTSLMLEMNKYLEHIDNGEIINFDKVKQQYDVAEKRMKNARDESEKTRIEGQKKIFQDWFDKLGGTRIHFSTPIASISNSCSKGKYLIAFFDSKRHTLLNVPQGISKIEPKTRYEFHDTASINFVQYMVNLKAEKSFARDDNDEEAVSIINQWFARLQDRLKTIFNDDKLKLVFDRKEFNFTLVRGNKEKMNFNTLPDGYSSIISIISEILMRMESHVNKSYDIEGIVLIDEIETHLHVELQKKILPFLIDFFPRIQFIVSTHSPFVLSSISNATICDLESGMITTDLSSYSYDVLIESFFDVDKYSEEVKQNIEEFEALIANPQPTVEQKAKLRELRDYFAHSPKYLSSELFHKLGEIELQEKLKNKK